MGFRESRESIEVIKSGLLTTVQDLGRTGYQQYGMVVSGAMDSYSLRMGNILVGNNEGEAGLEITLIGPTLRFVDDAVIAITGGDLSPRLNGECIPMWTRLFVEKGSTLEFGQMKQGMRAYLAIRGGIDVPLVMNSRSTYLKAEMGGFMGRALKKGDRLKVYHKDSNGNHPLYRSNRRRLQSNLIPIYRSSIQVRVIMGPQVNMFVQKSIEDFFDQPYKITPQSDRMGYRLQGEKLKHKVSADIITDAIVMGSIQVPASGDPIILLADRQTTGGYPKIATIISVDLPLVAQAKPGDEIRFIPISVDEAQHLYIEQERMIKRLKIINECEGLN